MNCYKRVKYSFFSSVFMVFLLFPISFSFAQTLSGADLSKCVESLKKPATKRIYIQAAGEKLLAQLDEVVASLESEKDPEKRKQLEIKKMDLLEQIDEKLEKKCKTFTFLNN